MSTNTKPLQGRHRAESEDRPTPLAAVSLPMLLGGIAVALVALLVAWQVV